MVYVSVNVMSCIFPSFTTPTWQGNSQSSDLKGRETGRGGGKREREREERVLAEARQETDSDGQKQGNKLPSKSCTHNSCIRGFPVKVVDAFSPKEQQFCKPKAQLLPHMFTVTVTLAAIHSLTQTHTACNY